MNWLALEAFASLSETLSFTKTAARLGVTQPNISKLISALESELEVSLFNRNRKHVSLTPAGIELRKAFVSRHQDLREALLRFQSQQKGLTGKIRIGCLPEMGINVVYPHLLRFQLENPGVQISVTYYGEAEILRGLSEGRLDLGICASGETSELFRAYPILTENIRILGTPKMIQKLQSGHWECAPWVEPVEADLLTAGFLRANRKRLPFKEREVKMVVNSHRSMVQALLKEIGFAVLPEESARHELDSGKLAFLPDFHRKDRIFLLMPDVERVSDRIKAALNHFLELKKTT